MSLPLNDFLQHCKTNGCSYYPIEGGNLTGIGVRIVNDENKRTHCLQIYKGGEVSDREIKFTCDRLWIKYPPHLRDLED